MTIAIKRQLLLAVSTCGTRYLSVAGLRDLGPGREARRRVGRAWYI
jgi:hypothetical protein